MNNNNEENQQQLTSLISKEINTTQIQISPQINKISSSEDNSQNNLPDLSSILKEIPLHNLNDYYNIETNVFKKRIEKLNLQFFWIYESILEGQNTNTTDNNNNKQSLIFPYNKLFLILFKEISLYIEEILRLNKQLNAKNKNEKFYMKKLNDYKSKEKEYFINKQIIKTLQRSLRNLEKNNEKLKNENEKLSKKLFNAKYSHNHGSGFIINSNVNNYRYKNLQKANTIYNELYGYNNSTEQGSLMSSNSNRFSARTYINKSKEKNLSVKKSPSKDIIFTNNKDENKLINSHRKSYESKESDKYFENVDDNKILLYLSINQCQDEINNLNTIENLLLNYNQNENKTLIKEQNKSLKKLMNTPLNYKINSRQNENSTNKKLLFTDKRYKKINKSLDFKTNIITNKNKS